MKDKNIESIQLCVWKDVSDEDKRKLAGNDLPVTLSPEKPCHNCDGYDNKCKDYEPVED